MFATKTRIAGAVLVCLASASLAGAQEGSLLRRASAGTVRAPLTLETGSLIFRRPEAARSLQLHDIVTVEVNINARVLSEGDAEQRKQANLNMVLADWVVLDGLRKVIPDPQTAGSPRINGQLNSQYRAESDVETRNSLTFTIAAQVVDVRPNGTLLIEARRTFQINDEVWEHSLSGMIRREDVSPLNVVKTEDVAQLEVHKREIGQVRDGYKAGWGKRLYDRFLPF